MPILGGAKYLLKPNADTIYVAAEAGITPEKMKEFFGRDCCCEERKQKLNRLGMWSLLVFPAGYGIAAGIVAAVSATLYNAASALVGGIKVEIPDIEPVWPDTEKG